jgi:hypothetical protein
MRPLLATDTVAVGVTVIATLVIVALAASVGYLLKAVRELRQEAEDLARQAADVLGELQTTVRQAGLEVDRVDRLVGSAEAISDAVGSASRLVGGAVASPFIKVVAFGAGLNKGIRLARGGAATGDGPEVRGTAGPGGRRRQRRAAKASRSAVRSSRRLELEAGGSAAGPVRSRSSGPGKPP